MCGIAGIFSTSIEPVRMRASAEAMQLALAHRGPDDAGLWESNSGNAVLAHRRLSIIDLSTAARQPMSTPDQRFTICFNGEIYNFRELRADLEKGGAHFETTSDTEVILKLYERDGDDCVKQLRGMFAFAIWDDLRREAFLARDPFGIKPLYVHQTATSLAFASELRALTKSKLFTPTLNSTAVRRYFETGSVPSPMTLINEAQCLGAGQTLTWSDGRAAAQTYWRIDFDHAKPVVEEPVKVTRRALEDSVQHHFVSDVPVGVFLSGGIDSTALLALSNATDHRGVNAFCIAVDEPAADESNLARRTAAHFGAKYHEMKLDADLARSVFADFLQHLDQPTIDGLNTFTVSALARQHGMKVVLSGLGGDELFGGYSSFQTIPRMLRWRRMLKLIPGTATVLAHGKPRHRRMADLVKSKGTVKDAFSALRGIFSQAEAVSLSQWITGGSGRTSEADESSVPTSQILDQISFFELTRYMRNQLLRDSDVMSMAHGLELRVPLVDRVLFESIAGIPAAVRLQAGKRLLVDAVPELPQWVTQEKKRGFLFPYQKWLQSGWKSAFDEATHGTPVPLTQWYQLWSVFILKHCLRSLGLQA